MKVSDIKILERRLCRLLVCSALAYEHELLTHDASGLGVRAASGIGALEDPV